MAAFIQFIAGAICPKCKKLDTIAISKDDDMIYCVKCSFIENRPKDPNSKTNTIKAINTDGLNSSKN